MPPGGTLEAKGHADSQLTRRLRDALHAVLGQLQFGQVLLASIGSTAPFIGLFGTVWGIYHALLSISAAGTITIEKVSGPVGEALIMTAAGLAVAIPAVLAYNVFGKRVARQRGRARRLRPRPARDDRRRRADMTLHALRPAARPLTDMAFGRLERTPGVAADERHQHDAADRRHAGAAGDLHDHRAADDLEPEARPAARPTRPSPATRRSSIAVALDKDGRTFFGDEALEPAAFAARVAAAAQRNPQTEVQLRADRSVPYGRVAELIGIVQKAGLSRIGFVTEPPPQPRSRRSDRAGPVSL